jgi:V/A-type H+-transporting ATPase subunit I
MIFGDAAYGSLLLIAAIFGIVRTSKKGVPLAVKMLFLFSVSNLIWGTLTCTWFGVEVEKLPQFFRDISLSYISTAKGTPQIMVNQNLQLFCFSLALLQLSIARVGAFFRCLAKKNLLLFAHLGSLAMLWGMFNVVLFLVVSNDTRSFPLLPVSLYLLGGGFILVFIFGYYEGSVAGAVLSSLKNIISVILGVTGVFSDIMSYIRLWAVGLAGASLAATINNMAGPMLGNFLIFFGIILLCFGHGLNIVLNVLSVLVHGVRLNILEFSGHVGLTWSGISYKPFAETAKK